MARDTARIDQVIGVIESAFADVGYPGDRQMVRPGIMGHRQDKQISAFYGGSSWRDIPAKTIATKYGALCDVSAAGFQYLLPAFMIWTLRNINCGKIAVEDTVYSLNPGGSEDDLRDFLLSKYELITTDQRTAIIAFLEVFRGDEYFGDDVAKALRNYWKVDV